MIRKLINPFNYIAGFKSLIIGLLVIIFTSVIGYYSNTHFPDIISVKACPDFPILYFIVQGLLNWLVVSSLFYFAALVFSKSSVRAIDIYGTQALSRIPYLFVAFIGFFKTVEKFSNQILWTLMQQGESVDITVVEIIFAIIIMVVTLLLTIWLITLMFNAFKVSANIKGTRLILIFIVVLIVSIILTLALTNMLIQKIQIL